MMLIAQAGLSDGDGVDFIEDGAMPAVFSEPELVDMTVEDVKSISAV